MQEGTVDHFIKEVGESLDDFTISRTADGVLGRNRVMSRLHQAQTSMFTWFSAHGASPTQFARKVTVTEDSENTGSYFLPPRMIHILSVSDASGRRYSPVTSRLRQDSVGFIVERRASTNASRSRGVITFYNCVPSGAVTVYVVEEPVRMSGGDGTSYGATAMTLEASPDLGTTVTDDDYYNGVGFVITQSGSAAFGLEGNATDYVGSTRVLTLPTWSTTPTADDDYSTVCSLPRVLWRVITLEAMRLIMRTTKRYDDVRGDILDELAELKVSAALSLRKPAEGAVDGPRRAERWTT